MGVMRWPTPGTTIDRSAWRPAGTRTARFYGDFLSPLYLWHRALDAVEEAGLLPLDHQYQLFPDATGPYRLIGTIRFACGHLVLATWPAQGYAQLDFTAERDINDFAGFLDYFGYGQRYTVDYIERGAQGTASLIEAHLFYSHRTELQQYDLLDTQTHGKVLAIDGGVQLAEVDAFIYHEALCWMPMLYHPNPKRILIAGGASGWAARTALQFPQVEHITQVDIDQSMVALASRFYGNDDIWRDPRVSLEYADIASWLAEYWGAAFDVILLDLTDPVNSRTSLPLMAPDFFQLLAERLGDSGVLATQAGTAWLLRDQLKATYWLAKEQFADARAYECSGIMERGPYAFVMAGQALSEHSLHAIPASARFMTAAYADNAWKLPPFIAEMLREKP